LTLIEHVTVTVTQPRHHTLMREACVYFNRILILILPPWAPAWLLQFVSLGTFCILDVLLLLLLLLSLLLHLSLHAAESPSLGLSESATLGDYYRYTKQ
jgi:hypothetical protein